MKKIDFKKSNWDELQDMTTEYFAELGYKNDGFHNGFFFDSEAYSIAVDEKICGFFSLGNSWEGGKMLCGFYVVPEKRRFSEDIFGKLIEEMNVQAALVPSNDGHFVSLAFEKMRALGTGFEMQAYQFTYGEPEREAEYGMEFLTEVQPEEYDAMNSLTEGQWDGCYSDPAFSFYAIRKDGKTLGYGAMGKLKYNDKYVDVGNYTLPEFRRQGVGRSLLINISKLVLQQGKIPIAGCWYGNKESIPTLKSSGFIPENRIFYVKFK